MRFKGVRVDLEKSQNIKLNLIKREEILIKKIKDLTGVDVEIMAARSIAKAFDKQQKVMNQVLQKTFYKIIHMNYLKL